MSVVDELEIELTANAKKANSTIDNLVIKLDTLSGSLSKNGKRAIWQTILHLSTRGDLYVDAP